MGTVRMSWGTFLLEVISVWDAVQRKGDCYVWQCTTPQGLCLTLGHHRQILRCLGECGTVWTWGVGGTQGHDPYPLVLMSLTCLL